MNVEKRRENRASNKIFLPILAPQSHYSYYPARYLIKSLTEIVYAQFKIYR